MANYTITKTNARSAIRMYEEYGEAYIHRSPHLGVEVKDWLRDYEAAESEYIVITRIDGRVIIRSKLRGMVRWEATPTRKTEAVAAIVSNQWGV